MRWSESMPPIGEYRVERAEAAPAPFAAADSLISSQLVVAPQQWSVASGSVAKLNAFDASEFLTTCRLKWRKRLKGRRT
uniref:Uncharacterized protein n=1 Tax=Glossina austeni TaxID=7395 RepID=A0A1A9VII6_GLOAU